MKTPRKIHLGDRGNGAKFSFACRAVVEGVAIDPVLGVTFDSTRNEDRTPRQMAWWDVPFILTARNAKGLVYIIRCLDGGAWDRSTLWGQTDSLQEAIKIAQAGPEWKEGIDPKLLAATSGKPAQLKGVAA